MIFCFILSLLLTAQPAAQNNTPDEYVITHWGLDEGLPQSSVNDIIQTRDGYMWLASFGGLVRFDGVKFTVFNRFNSPGMLYDRIIDLFEDSENRIWMKTEGGVVCYNRGGSGNAELFKTFTVSNGLPNEEIQDVVQDPDGAIWIFAATDKYYKLVDEKFVPQELSNDEDLRQRALHGEGTFFQFQFKKILRYIDGKLIAYVDLNNYTSSVVWDVKEGPDGTLYIATNEEGVIIINPRKLNEAGKITTADGLISNSERMLMVDNTGYLWVAGWGGINRVNLNKPDKIYKLYQKESKNKLVSCVTKDYEGNYWFGSGTDGLIKVKKAVIRTYTSENGLNSENLLSLYYRHNGTLLVATNCGGIYELRDERIVFSTLSKYLTNSCVWSVFEDSHNRIWVGAEYLTLIEGNESTHISKQTGVDFSFVWAIYKDKKGKIWIGDSNGLIEYSDGKFIQYTISDDRAKNEVHSIYEDSKGNLWIGTLNGLNIMKDGKIKEISVPGVGSNYIRAIYEDKNGTMWFGSYGGGLIRLKDNEFKVFTTEDGMFDNIVSHIVEDQFGYFWMGCNRGISRVGRNELNEYAEGRINSLTVVSYGKQDGMVSVETNGGFQPNAVKDKDGRIYFPTVQGLAVVNPADIVYYNYVPPVHIENFLIDGKDKSSILISKSGVSNNRLNEFPFDSSDVQINYTALSYADPEKVKFKYKLAGFDDDWIDAGTARSAYYRQLPPGEYVFTVLAVTNEGIWNEKGASVSFVITPPFWMTWWFRSIFIAAFLSIGPLIYYRRVTALKGERARQRQFSRQLIESQEDERKRIAYELHDGIGQDLLIIKNKLLTGLHELKGGEKTESFLTDILDVVSDSIHEAREISHNMRPPHLDQLGLTLALEYIIDKISESSGIEIIYDAETIDGLIPQENEINFFRIVQESLNNIVKHSGADKAWYVIKTGENKIHLSIKDNGKGIIPANVKRGTGIRPAAAVQPGLGISGMMERVKILGGEISFRRPDEGGTLIEIVVPTSKQV